MTEKSDEVPAKGSRASQQGAAQSVGVPVAQRHILLCCDQTKPNCCAKERGLEAWEYLRRRLKELGLSEQEHLIQGRLVHEHLIVEHRLSPEGPVVRVERIIVEKIEKGLAPIRLEIKNESGMHTAPQTKLATDYCDSCSMAGGEACKTASPSRPDTLAPVWNATLLTNLTAAALKASLRVDVSDADVAFNDVVGGCAITRNGSEFDGALHTVNCPAAAGGVALSLDYRLKAH